MRFDRPQLSDDQVGGNEQSSHGHDRSGPDAFDAGKIGEFPIGVGLDLAAKCFQQLGVALEGLAGDGVQRDRLQDRKSREQLVLGDGGAGAAEGARRSGQLGAGGQELGPFDADAQI